MSTAVRADPRTQRVIVTGEAIAAHLMSGRVIGVPPAYVEDMPHGIPARRPKQRV